MRIAHWDTQERPLVVAEIGNNHEGDLAVALELIEAAAAAGAGAVKFQTIVPDRLVRPTDSARLEQLKRFQLEPEGFARLSAAARDLGLLFGSTPFDLDSVPAITDLVDFLKIASGDNDFVPLLQRVGATGKPVVMSAGLAGLDAIRDAKRVLEAAGAGDLAILHCVAAYPVEPDQAELGAIPVLARELGVTIGYSDHTVGTEASVLAAALGARVIEKHFTLRHDFSDFRDHQLSATPDELRQIVQGVERAVQLVGRGSADVQPAEEAALSSARRSIAAAADLAEGHVLTPEDLTWLRPRDGLKPGEEGDLVGRRLNRDVPRGDTVHREDVE